MHSAICHRLLWSNGSFLLRENTPVIPPGELVEAQGPTFKVQRPKVIAGWRSFKVTQKTNTVDHQQLHDTRQYCLVHMFYGWLGTRSNGGVLPDVFECCQMCFCSEIRSFPILIRRAFSECSGVRSFVDCARILPL